jgi:hypothetical protein
MSAAEVPEVVDKVKAKIAQWKADQPEQTRKVCSPRRFPMCVTSH